MSQQTGDVPHKFPVGRESCNEKCRAAPRKKARHPQFLGWCGLRPKKSFLLSRNDPHPKQNHRDLCKGQTHSPRKREESSPTRILEHQELTSVASYRAHSLCSPFSTPNFTQ